VISQALPVFALAPLLVLWLGYGLGRATTQADPAETPGSAVATGTEETATPATGSTNAGRTVTAARTPEDAYGFAAVRLLASTGSLLTQVEDQVASGALRADAGTWARGLLTRTRLMLDSPSMVDDDLRALLEDLELILMQVVTVSGAQDGGHAEVGGFELRQLTNGLREGDVLPRIQRMLPPVIASDS